MDQIHEAFTELSFLGIITSSTENTVTLNLSRLYALGYILIFNLSNPVFITILDFNYMYDAILFYGDTIPKESLSTFVLSKIKTMGISK